MKQGIVTAMIEKVKVGRVDHYKNIMMSATFNMNGTACSLTFSMEESQKMMEDVGLYESIFDLSGLPCEIEIDDHNTCRFRGMWKK